MIFGSSHMNDDGPIQHEDERISTSTQQDCTHIQLRGHVLVSWLQWCVGSPASQHRGDGTALTGTLRVVATLFVVKGQTRPNVRSTPATVEVKSTRKKQLVSESPTHHASKLRGHELAGESTSIMPRASETLVRGTQSAWSQASLERSNASA